MGGVHRDDALTVTLTGRAGILIYAWIKARVVFSAGHDMRYLVALAIPHIAHSNAQAHVVARIDARRRPQQGVFKCGVRKPVAKPEH